MPNPITLAEDFGNSTAEFLISLHGQPNAFAATGSDNKLLQTHLPDTVVTRDGSGRIPLADLPSSLTVGGMQYKGVVDASAGAEPVVPAPENNGWQYKVSVAGTIAGHDLDVGDFLISNGSGWDKIDGTDSDIGTVNDFATALAARWALG